MSLRCKEGDSGLEAELCDEQCPTCPEAIKALQKAVISFDGVHQLFRVLADETRSKIVYLLTQRELCGCDLAEILGVTTPAISHHLKILRDNHLVKLRRDGKFVLYSLDDHHVLNLISQAKEHLDHQSE